MHSTSQGREKSSLFREITLCPSRMWARARSRVAAMRNLRDALGQQPVDGAEWHWQRSCNVAPVRQREGTLAPRQPSLHRVPRPWCLQEHIPRASVQTLVLPAACLTCRGHLGLDAAEGVATLPSAGLGAVLSS